jgi:hypothetical protein
LAQSLIGGAMYSSIPAVRNSVNQTAEQIAAALKNVCIPDCAAIVAKIAELTGNLRQRYLQATIDKHDLYYAKLLGQFSWIGHKTRYELMQIELTEKITEARANGCVYDPDADVMASMPFPAMPAW